MRIALVTLNSAEYRQLAYLTFFMNKKHYCLRHGYEAVYHVDGFSGGFFSGFQKIFLLKKLLDKLEHDWLYWCGCDTMVTNFNIKLESFLDESYHFIIAADFQNINADSFFIRNSAEGRNYINMIVSRSDRYKTHHGAEQQIMIDSLPEFRNIIKIVPQKAFNAYEYPMYEFAKNHYDITGHDGTWSPGDFLVHWPATLLPQRITLARKYLQKIVK